MAQWAARLATEHGLNTQLHAPREDEHHLASRLAVTLGKVPVISLLRGDAAGVDARGLSTARAALSRSHLGLRCGPTGLLPSAAEEAGARALVLDDVDLIGNSDPLHLRRIADAGAVVVVSLPRNLLVQDRDLDGDLDPRWSRAADVILEVRTRRLENRDLGERAGEADFTLLKHHRGPTATFTVSFTGFYSRFKDMR